jgi:hypothetical protein
VSLILDALRKLEREKSSHDPGVLVVGSVPWGERSRTGRLLLAASALVVVAGAVLAGWLLRSNPAPQAASRPVVPAATSLPSPSASAVTSPTPQIAPSPLPTEAPAPPIRLSHPPAGAGRAPAAAPRASEASAPAPVEDHDSASDAAPTPRHPPSAAPGGSEELRLSAISQRDGKPVALINDRLVFEGDSFDGVHVVHIGETEVEVEVKGQKKVLRF